jgi:hypothetical protein
MPAEPLFVLSCANSGLLEEMYQAAIASQDPALMLDIFRLTEGFARVKFVPQYLMLLRVLKPLLEVAGWQGYAVSLLATLSIYAEARMQLATSQIGPKLAQLRNDPTLGRYAQCYLKNVPE